MARLVLKFTSFLLRKNALRLTRKGQDNGPDEG